MKAPSAPHIVFFGIVAALAWTLYLTMVPADIDYSEYPRCNITFNNGGNIDNVPLADTRARISLGLSHNPDPQSMLFIWPKSKAYAFWMKDALEPLNILFIERGGRIDSIYEMDARSTTRYQGSTEATMALEVSPVIFNDLGVTQENRVTNIECVS